MACIVLLSTVILLVSTGTRPTVSAAPPNAKSPEPPNPAQVLIGQYQERVRKGESDQLIQECGKAIEADPKNFVAYVGRGLALNAKGEYERAIKDFDAATGIGGREPVPLTIRAEAYANRSFALHQEGKYLDAINSAYFALLEKGDHAAAHHFRAMGYIGWNKPDKAIQSADRAIQLNPDFAEAYSTRGYAHGIKGNLDKVIEDQSKALQLQPNFAVALERRAVAYLAKGNADAAAKDIEQALKLKPDFAEALVDRAVLYGLKGNSAQAMADLDQAVKISPKSTRAQFQRGAAFLAYGKPDQALECLNEAIRLKGDFVAALNLRGNILLNKKEYTKAVEDFSQVILADPKFVAAYTARNQAYKKLGMHTEAQADLAKLHALQPPAGGKTSKQKKEDKDHPPPRFQVVSREVAPSRRPQALQAAKQIDALVEANYKKFNVEPDPLTSDSEFVRRIYLDITGTIPTYQQTRKFLVSHDPAKRAMLIDELLSSDGYASHFFNYWADVLRYTDHLTTSVRGEPYRQWIKQSLAENKPWNKFVEELLTAEGLIWQNPATGYLQRDANMPLDNMNNTVRIFLGTRIGCAQCHNHPFDRWTQKEFYQMAAFTFGTVANAGGGDKRFWATDPGDRLHTEYAKIEQEEEDRRNNSYRFDEMLRVNMALVNDQGDRPIHLPKNYAYDDAKPDEVVPPKTLFGSTAEIRTGETPRKAFARWLTEKENPRFARTIANRLWKQAFGVGQIEPVDDMTDESEAENPPLMDFLEAQMKQLDFDMKEYLRIVFNTQAYQRRACAAEVAPGTPYHFPGPILRRMTAEQVWDSFLTMTLVNPDDFHELPATLRTDVFGKDLSKVSAEELLDADNKRGAVDGIENQWKDKHMYKGTLLARASELPSPVPPNHFLRMFGQSDRELIATSSTVGSVPQVLFMFNGPVTHMLLEKNSAIYNNVMRKQSVNDGVKAVFLTVLSREPDAEDMELAAQEVKRNGPAGYGNVIWSLVNTREFLFIR